MDNHFYEKRELSKDLQEQAHTLCEIKTLEKQKAKINTRQRQLVIKLCKIIDRMTVREMNSKRGERK